MKYRAILDLDLTNEDVFEEEVIKAMKAYAKTIARRAFEKEIAAEMEECLKKYAYDYFHRDWYIGYPKADAVIRDEIKKEIKETKLLSHLDDVIMSTCDESIKEKTDIVKSYVSEEMTRRFDSEWVKTIISKEVKEAVPDIVLNLLKGKE